MTTQTPIAHGQLIQVDKAIESWRDSGYDLPAAVGEVVDNSIEARAKHVRIKMAMSTESPVTVPAGKGKKSPKAVRTIDAIAFADDGTGIPLNVLANVLTLGFSTRYNQRDGIGRFGVGMKLGAISKARRIDVYTRPLGSTECYHTFIDLDLIASGAQEHIEVATVPSYPDDFADLMQDPKTAEPFASGTLVVWSKVDRLTEGGKYGSGLDQRLSELLQFLARAYRRFIDQGLDIELDGTHVTLHDPLFLLDNPRLINRFRDSSGTTIKEIPQATIVDQNSFAIDGHDVTWTVTLYPEIFRRKRLIGGRGDRDEVFKDLHIPENEGRISILRQGREIYYNVIPQMLPSGGREGDRFIGIEVSFPAALDEYFQVRHVKRGAEPVDKLRGELRNALSRPVIAARKEIRALWDRTEALDHKVSEEHQAAHTAVNRAEQTSPRGMGGLSLSPQDQIQVITDLLDDLGADPETTPGRVQEIKQHIEELPITIVDSSWPGKELLEIVHLNGKAIIKFNHRHPFMREIYDPIKQFAERDSTSITPAEALRLARKTEVALDVLFMAYAKAENMHRDPETAYGDLRSYWGQFTQAYVREALREESVVSAASPPDDEMTGSGDQ